MISINGASLGFKTSPDVASSMGGASDIVRGMHAPTMAF
jgi:hypothetical protein